MAAAQRFVQAFCAVRPVIDGVGVNRACFDPRNEPSSGLALRMVFAHGFHFSFSASACAMADWASLTASLLVSQQVATSSCGACSASD